MMSENCLSTTSFIGNQTEGDDVCTVSEYGDSGVVVHGLSRDKDTFTEKPQVEYFPYRSPELSEVRKFKCLCGVWFSTEKGIRNHWAEKGLRKGFVCKTCNKAFATLVLVRQHEGSVHKCVSSKVCRECGQTFLSKKNFLIHMKKVHHKEIPSVNYFNPEKVANKQHMVQNSTRLKHPLKCYHCCKTFSTKLGLQYHVTVNLKEQPFKCGSCSKTFRCKNLLKSHILVHCDPMQHVCDTCGLSCKSSRRLKLHEGVHSGEKPYKCEICHQQFRLSLFLRNHYQSKHVADRPFKCDTCSKTFKLKKSLQFHMKCHFDDRPFSCPKCKKSFKTKPILNGHLFVHAKAASRYCCSFCNKTFRASFDLKAHEERHSGKYEFKCHVCTMEFKVRGNLKMHLKAVHCKF